MQSTAQKTRTPFTQMPPAQQAGILCNDTEFQKFAAVRCGMPGQVFSSTATAEYLRNCCRITSRSQLTTNPTANAAFQTLRTEFDAWAGRIQSPR